MDKLSHVENSVWWEYLTKDLQDLVYSSIFLAERADSWGYAHSDYSFVVFPMAKAYEGFLKKFFLDMGFISEGDYLGTHFRIGKALNPHLEDHLRGLVIVVDFMVLLIGSIFCRAKENCKKMKWLFSTQLPFLKLL
jgi:hypothetical protein